MRTKLITKDPFTDVVLQRVQAGGEELRQQAIMVKDDEGRFIHNGAIVGPEYTLVPNSICRDVLDDVMSRSKYEWTAMLTNWNGKQFQQLFHTTTAITEIANGGSHPIHVGLMIRNSYDGTMAFGFEIFAMNMICQNQYIQRNRFGYFSMRHTPGEAGSWDVNDALENVGIGAEKIIQIAPRIELLRSEPLTTTRLLETKAGVNIPNSNWGHVLDRLQAEEENRFGLYQALTAVCTHDIGGFTGSKYNNEVGNLFLGENGGESEN